MLDGMPEVELLVSAPEGRAELREGKLAVENAEARVAVPLSAVQRDALRPRRPSDAPSMEVERKLLVRQLPEDLFLAELKSARLRQGYLLIGEDASLRIRDKEGRSRLTIKRGRGLEREELEVEIDPQQAAALWPLAASRSLEKVRYLVPDGTGWLELDVYEGHLDGLMTVEREFESRAEAELWSAPDWVGTEVTGDARYTNAQLVLAAPPGHHLST